MVQTQKKDVVRPEKTNKIHKTLREKLRKRRQVQKLRKKEKSEQKKQYNSEEEKLKFFSKAQNKQDCYKQLKLKKIRKYIEEFINIYEDDLDEFYQMFKTFDDGGFIDISELANKALIKCLRQLFTYLPLKIEKGQYSKIKASEISLEKFMKQKVSESIQNYLQNGSNAQFQLQSSNEDNVEKKGKISHKRIVPKIQESNQNYEELQLYKQINNKDQPVAKTLISEAQKCKITQILIQQLKKATQLNQHHISKEQRQLSQMFQKESKNKQTMTAASKIKLNLTQFKKPINDKSMEKINNASTLQKIEQRILISKQLIEQKLKQSSQTKKTRKGDVQKSKSSFFNFNSKNYHNLTGNNEFI